MNSLQSIHAARSLRLLVVTFLTIAGVSVDSTTHTRRLGSLVSTNTRDLQNDLPVAVNIAPPVQKGLDPFTIRINAGSTEDYIDAEGLIWKSDATFINTGEMYSLCPLEIINTTLDALYCKERYFNKWVHINKPFRYDIPVPRVGSAYSVKLHFAEINYKSSKARVFDAWINGKLAIKALDIYNEVGYATAMIVPITTRITSTVAQISIELVSRIENPKLCAIEIIEIIDYVAPPTAAPVVQMFTKYISAGATENWYDDTTGILWEKDQFFGNKGAVHSICPAQINGTDLDPVYCKDRYFNKWEFSGPYRYDIPVPKNSAYYSVKLHFAEFYYQTARARMFDVFVNGKLIYKNLDIYEKAGPLTAFVLPVVTLVNNSTISIEFVSKVDNPKICAIEVMELSNYLPPPTNAPVLQPTLPFSTRISAGATEDWIDNDGVEWGKDKYYYNNKGGVHWVCPQPINGTELDSLYCKDRYFNKWEYNGPYRYDIPVPKNAAYSIKLHFAEVYYTKVGARVFDVLVNGRSAVKNLDIYKEAGYSTAFILPLVTMSSNTTVSIEFVSKIDNPKICAIEVTEIQNYLPPPTVAPVTPLKLPFSTRINAGVTEDWIDENGIIWEKDKYFNGKGDVFGTCPIDIADTDMDGLYCKERFFNQWKYKAPFVYEIPVPRSGAYSVKLHFAEVAYKIRGERIFDVIVNGKIIMGSLDIFAEVGFSKAYILPTITQASTGYVTIQLVPKVENPKICAIEVVELPNYIAPPSAAPVARPFEILINAGAVADFSERNTGRVWMKDQYFIGGGVLFKRHFDIIGSNDDEIFHIERWGEFRYEIPVAPGTYQLQLHFAELHWDFPGSRLFDVTIENSIHIKNFDIIKSAFGRFRVVTLTYILPVTDGLLSLEFKNSNPKVDQPKLSGIEVKFLSTSTEAINPFPILINCGGGEYVETVGATTRKWMADRHFVYGSVYDASADSRSQAIANKMYHTCRFGSFRYEIPVPIGSYEVTLHFEEPGYEAGIRLFDVVIEDVILYRNVDVAKIGNGPFKPIKLSSQVNVNDGLLSIVLPYTGKDNPMVSGIEVNLIENGPIAVPNFNPLPILINCGGGDYIETVGATTRTWMADRYFAWGGSSHDMGPDPRSQAIANKMYHTCRYGYFRYRVPVPIGNYNVTLHFAEPGYQPGNRIFDLVIEDVVVYKSVDVAAIGNGPFNPVQLMFQVSVNDGSLSLAFPYVKENPMISGIEITLNQKDSIATPTSSPIRAPVLVPIQAPTLASNPAKNCSIPRITPDAWVTPLAQYPITVAEPAGSMIGNDFVIFSGFKNGYVNATTETYALDMSVPTAVWRRMDDMPFAQGITHQGLVVIGRKAFLCGGYIGGSLGMHTDKCFLYYHYNKAGQRWSNFAPLPKGGRSGGAMIYDTTLNALVYAGGSQRATQGQPVAIDYKDTWMYSFDNPTAGWVPKSDIPFYGNHMNSITIIDSLGNERHYVFGGQVGDYELWGNTAVMYEYVATTDQWIQRTPMPFGRGHSASAVRAVGCGFIVAGGRTNQGLTGDILYYNPLDDTWQSIGRLPVDIHTNVCVVAFGKLRCETGWATGTFSTETSIQI